MPKKKQTSGDEQHAEEAVRLAQLPVAEQKKIIAMHRTDAANVKVPKADQDFARERAEALERHLRRLNRKKKNE
jgi:hypothetical protein